MARGILWIDYLIRNVYVCFQKYVKNNTLLMDATKKNTETVPNISFHKACF